MKQIVKWQQGIEGNSAMMSKNKGSANKEKEQESGGG